MKLDPDALEAEVLEPLRRYCERNRGAVAELLRELNLASAHPVWRATLESWLFRDPQRHKSPRFGAGLLLVRVARKVTGLKLKI